MRKGQIGMFEGIHDVRHMSSKMSVNVDHKGVSCIEWVRQEEKLA